MTLNYEFMSVFYFKLLKFSVEGGGYISITIREDTKCNKKNYEAKIIFL